MELKIMDCCICKKQIEPQRTESGEIYWTQGNSALPIHDGRCCNKCNAEIVIPARFTEVKLRRKYK
tara:strand:+ start:15492 stop:15689 length:198 start_codon:yes stop_codon:yes gene_type:complete